MIPTIASTVGDILGREGGYVDHPLDRGGPTNYGITQTALSEYRGHPVTIDEVKSLTPDEAKNIYLAKYLTAPGLHKIHDPYLLSLLFDCSILHGPFRTVKWLQTACGVPPDGEIGPQTEIAANSADPVRLYQRVLARRIIFIGEILNHDHGQAVFALGWLTRVASFVEV